MGKVYILFLLSTGLDFLFYLTGQKVHCVLTSHQALLVLVMFSKLISQAFINCCSTKDSVWHNVACWHHLLFFWKVFGEMVESLPKGFSKGFASEGMFQVVTLRGKLAQAKDIYWFLSWSSSSFFFFLFLKYTALCKWSLEWAVFSCFISFLFWSVPCSCLAHLNIWHKFNLAVLVFSCNKSELMTFLQC